MVPSVYLLPFVCCIINSFRVSIHNLKHFHILCYYHKLLTKFAENFNTSEALHHLEGTILNILPEVLPFAQDTLATLLTETPMHHLIAKPCGTRATKLSFLPYLIRLLVIFVPWQLVTLVLLKVHTPSKFRWINLVETFKISTPLLLPCDLNCALLYTCCITWISTLSTTSTELTDYPYL